MTNAEKRKLAKEVEDWLINVMAGIELEDLGEAADVIQKTVEDMLASEIAERSV